MFISIWIAGSRFLGILKTMKEIKSKEELLEQLNIKDINDLKKPEVQKRFNKLIKNNTVSISLLRDLLVAIPELTKVFSKIIGTMDSLGSSLEATKQTRWEVLQKIALLGILNGEQVLEAMKLIGEMEKEGGKTFVDVFKKAFQTLGVLAMVVGGGIALFYQLFGGNKSNSNIES